MFAPCVQAHTLGVDMDLRAGRTQLDRAGLGFDACLGGGEKATAIGEWGSTGRMGRGEALDIWSISGL